MVWADEQKDALSSGGLEETEFVVVKEDEQKEAQVPDGLEETGFPVVVKDEQKETSEFEKMYRLLRHVTERPKVIEFGTYEKLFS